MAVTATPAFVQNPKVFTTSIVEGDAQAWKLLTSQGAGAGANGAKLVSLTGHSTDSSARDVQFAFVRSAAVTISNASPGVLTWVSTVHNLHAGDQVFLTVSNGGSLPTGLAANTTYYVVSPDNLAGTFELSATFGGSAIDTSSAGSGTFTAYLVRPIATASVAAGAGNSSSVAAANLLSSSYWPGLPADNDGQSYLFLESGDYLGVSALVSVTSAKIITISANAGNF